MKININNKSIITLTLLISIISLSLFPLFKIYSQTTCNPDNLKPVRFGQKGLNVKNLQFCLIELGYNISKKEIGTYGFQTKKSIQQFYSEWNQKKWTGISIDNKGINEIKRRLISLKNENNKQETKEIIDKVRSYDLKFNVRDTEVNWFALSQDKKYAFIIVRNKKNDYYYIQINNQINGPYDYAYNLQLSNDGSKYGWRFKKDNKYYIQINNQTYGPYDYDYAYNLQLSNDGSKYGCRFIKDKKYYIQINNQTYGPYDDADYPRFSNNGSKYGWFFIKDNKYYIQINNQTYGPYDYANLTFTKDNKVYIIYIKDNKMIIEQID
jgi:hypothetical protein